MITGSELKAARKQQGLNQTQMGALIGYSRHMISYWERKAAPMTWREANYGALKDYLAALGIEVLRYCPTSTRACGVGVLHNRDRQQEAFDALYAKELARIEAKAALKAARYRERCRAKTRKGHPCRNMSEAGRRRCKFHGGMSTGPKTLAGKERIAEAQRKRWKKFREKFQSQSRRLSASKPK